MKNAAEILEFVRAALNLFKAAPTLANENFTDCSLDNEKNLAHGFFVTEHAFQVCPLLADEKIFDFLKKKFGYNIFELNQGFYKSFGTVANSTPQQILINKLLHYMSTYGMERLGIFDRELVYIPNDALELPADAKPIKITVIDAIDNAEIETRAVKMIQSGAALSEETLDDLITVIKFLRIKISADDVPNKEFAIRLCELLGILPTDPVQFLRYMIYIATGSTLLIKNAETITAIKNSTENFNAYFLRYVNNGGSFIKLASVFYRFKPLWLAFRQQSKNLRPMINKIRRIADCCHKPAPPKFLERLTSAEEINPDELKRELANVTTYRKVSLVNAVLYRLANPDSIVYHIRNGKAFADDYRGSLKFDAQKILDEIVGSIVADIAPNVRDKKIFIPAQFTYAAPVSEKKFIGNIPQGSSYTFESKSVVVGVHWFNLLEADGKSEVRIDLDLHLNSLKRDIGWFNDYIGENFTDTRDRKVIFSGDMTDAPIASGGATEAFFVGETVTDELMMINLNHYNHYSDSKPVPFKLVLADVTQDSIDRKYLLDAHEIAFCVPNEISSGEMFLGVLATNDLGEKKFYFHSANTGNRIVARSDDLTAKLTSAINTTLESVLTLNEILRRAGAILDDVTVEDCDINLDPAEVTKDTLLDLFAK